MKRATEQLPSTDSYKCVTVIQARRGSSRLPDKILMPLAGVTVLERVIQRCKAIQGVDKVVCAIPDDEYNDPVEQLAIAAGASVCRGSEDDVLSRYVDAVIDIDTKYVMRVTADCPFLDPEVCQDLLEGVEQNAVEYGGTAHWPHGLDCEVFNKDLLLQAGKEATHAHDREHVTLWMKRHCETRNFICRPDKDYFHEHRWVLDYPEDLAFLERLVSLIPSYPEIVGWREVLEAVNADPALKTLNHGRIAEWREKTNQIIEEAGRNA